MAEVIPFRGVLYNISKLSPASGEDLLAPPYDIITPEYRNELYEKSPYNIVRIDFGEELGTDAGNENKYSRAKGYFEKWLDEQVLTRSRKPCFYSYEISYRIDNEEKTLRGFLGLVRLEELGKGNIHPHECTHSKPKKDRLELMRICEANISPIFSLFSGRGENTAEILARTSSREPYIGAKDMDGAVHRLWEISDPAEIRSIKEELANRSIYIADGHHRYETALEYQKEMQQKEGISGGPRPYDYVMMFLADTANEGLTILPTHRLVKDIPDDFMELLSDHFDIKEVTGNFDIKSALAGQEHVLGFYKGDSESWYILNYRGGDLSELPPVLAGLDVSILHDLIFGKLLKSSEFAYEMDVRKCLHLVRENLFAAAFFLNPTRVDEVENVALASLRMPPKSTYFYPKLLTGLVLNSFKYTF